MTVQYMRVTAFVEAFQFDGDFMSDAGYYVPQWAVDALHSGKLFFECADLYYKGRYGNRHIVNAGDFVVLDEYGEIWSLPEKDFNRLYRRCADEV